AMIKITATASAITFGSIRFRFIELSLHQECSQSQTLFTKALWLQNLVRRQYRPFGSGRLVRIDRFGNQCGIVLRIGASRCLICPSLSPRLVHESARWMEMAGILRPAPLLRSVNLRRPRGRSTFLQLGNGGQQLTAYVIFGYESVDTSQCLLRDVHCRGKHDDWR